MAVTALDFKNSGMAVFPREEVFANAETLEFLDISGNRMASLPDDLGCLRKLRILFASGNPIRHLPASLGECPRLSTIGFRGCGIESIAVEAFSPSLESIILTDNRLSQLPDEIGRCRKLRKLMLTGNGLSELPESLRECSELELLRLAVNRVHTVPLWLTQMPSLAWVALGGNPLCAETENEEVMKSIPWNSLQCLELLGQGASGMIHRAVWRQAGGTERHVAVKIFKGGLTSDGFPLSELTASLAAGRHQNLAATIGRVSDHPQGCSALVMELIDPSFVNLAGPPSLETITRDIYPKNLRFHLAAVGRTLLGVAEAAAHLHGRGILHGDLYAHNILWQADRHHALLGDFGAASLHDLRRDHALALQRVEVRAFGLLLDELLERCDETKSGATWRLFQELRRACLAANPMERPLFQEIVAIVSRG